MNKKQLTEQEIRSQYIRPAITAAGWHNPQIREEYYYNDGRMNIQGHTVLRGERAFVDYLLIYTCYQKLTIVGSMRPQPDNLIILYSERGRV